MTLTLKELIEKQRIMDQECIKMLETHLHLVKLKNDLALLEVNYSYHANNFAKLRAEYLRAKWEYKDGRKNSR